MSEVEKQENQAEREGGIRQAGPVLGMVNYYSTKESSDALLRRAMKVPVLSEKAVQISGVLERMREEKKQEENIAGQLPELRDEDLKLIVNNSTHPLYRFASLAEQILNARTQEREKIKTINRRKWAEKRDREKAGLSVGEEVAIENNPVEDFASEEENKKALEEMEKLSETLELNTDLSLTEMVEDIITQMSEDGLWNKDFIAVADLVPIALDLSAEQRQSVLEKAEATLLDKARIETANDVEGEFNRLMAMRDKAIETIKYKPDARKEGSLALLKKEMKAFVDDGVGVEEAFNMVLTQRIAKKLETSLELTLGQYLSGM